MSYLQPIRNTTIVVTDEEFANGYQVGYLQYRVDYKSKPPTEMDIYTLIVGTITSVRHSGRYHAGYVTGWIAALLEDYKPSVIVAALVEGVSEEVNVCAAGPRSCLPLPNAAQPHVSTRYGSAKTAIILCPSFLSRNDVQESYWSCC